MRRILVALLLASLPLNLYAGVVLDTTPISRVTSGESMTERSVLPEEERLKNALTIVERDGRYFWTSRENRELFYLHEGVVHLFIDPSSGGYVKIIDMHHMPALLGVNPEPGPRFVYFEHVSMLDATITYWGESTRLAVD